jgi:hypothetical protein
MNGTTLDSNSCHRDRKGCGHKLYKDNFFSSPELTDGLTKKKINCCGTVRLNRKGMPGDIRCKTVKLRRGDIHIRTRGALTAYSGWTKEMSAC